ncbi:uncharacterized protein LOC117292961 [Asterias rubens]|uniref:uncharacterized protein LOC117292961 n=1 Tax=Asterias rubens TaxID=7604 RepID=UPI00145552A4|nr:uncharacterized protein LOC117292961 [Asterias rubens]
MKLSLSSVLRIQTLNKSLVMARRVLSSQILPSYINNQVSSHTSRHLMQTGMQQLRFNRLSMLHVKSPLPFTSTSRNSLSMLSAHQQRFMTTGNGLTSDMLRREMENLSDRFMEAKELLDDARESMGTVYFNDDLEDADGAVEETLKEYKSLLARLSEEQKQTVMRTIGLRMEELSAQQIMIRESLKD